ncbi:predicted protein [Sclerotinia sclerotiorum 1980 UF-70]|uniref:LysM domain-containing protein n=2 Tax=Sclerotinia sclerotiorum (strain ATCC 18683 / 1980 / Ss-1) TaxID=665079 RepID=A7EI71_SCLS1|nr:predicted protein [Sclerotinia sclerotiorum 1980 UF-70]APA11575.1 hypothetical protein sscle_08g063450 [Sclerotinia sclerotiorum 1980 UF-70]EDO02537.1 predicted protein [Sclerotinia sclerotiorum 1980 UF-70]
MFPATFNMQLLAVVTLLLANTFANPIKRSDDETTVVRLPGLFGLFTTVATSALTTSEIVGVVVISSSTIYIQEPNFFPTTVWGVPEITSLGTPDPITTASSTSYSFPTFSLKYNASATLVSSLETVISTSTAAITDQAQIKAVKTSSCNTDVAGVTIPTSALTTGEFVAVETLCGATIYIQEPNYYPTKTYYSIPASSTTSTLSCNTAVVGVKIDVGNLTIGQFVAATVICGRTVYIQESNFYTPKTYYRIPASAPTTSALASSTTGAAVKARVLEVCTGHNIPFFGQHKPTLLHQADRNWIKSVPSSVAGNRGARAFRERQG